MSRPIGEDGGFVGMARVMRVFEDDDFVVRPLAGKNLRIDFAGGEPEAAAGIEIHLDRLGQHRVGGPKLDVETVGDLQGLALELGVGGRDVFDFLLGECVGGGRGEASREQGEENTARRARWGESRLSLQWEI